jgi:RpiB/LacA/LacB family sugar-phosphate isomerase
MKIAVGADHRGYSLKGHLVKFLRTQGFEVGDFGTHRGKSCDYPPIATKVGVAVASGKFDKGILICNSGLGMSIMANKIKGVRAALCYTKEVAKASKEHNDANIIVLGAGFVSERRAKDFINAWLRARFLRGRHARRVSQIKRFEKQRLGATI